MLVCQSLPNDLHYFNGAAASPLSKAVETVGQTGLSSKNIPLSIVHQEDKQDYYKALVNTRESKNIEIFRNFMFAQLEKQLMKEIKKATKKTINKTNNRGGMSFLF